MTDDMCHFAQSLDCMAKTAETRAIISWKNDAMHAAWTAACLAITDAAQALEDAAADIDGIYAVPDDVYELPLPQPVCVSPGIYKRFVP